MTPRGAFVLTENPGRAYRHTFLDIGSGVTISGPRDAIKGTRNER